MSLSWWQEISFLHTHIDIRNRCLISYKYKYKYIQNQLIVILCHKYSSIFMSVRSFTDWVPKSLLNCFTSKTNCQYPQWHVLIYRWAGSPWDYQLFFTFISFAKIIFHNVFLNHSITWKSLCNDRSLAHLALLWKYH